MQKRIVTSVFALFITTYLSGQKALADPDDLSETEGRALQVQLSLKNCLTRESYQLASELGLVDLLSRLKDLREHEKHKHGAPLSPESTTLRQEITEVVLTTSLQCQAVIAQIESETANAVAVKAAMQGRRDRAGRTNAIANIVANGSLQAVGGMIQEPFETNPNSRTEIPGEAVAAAGTLMAAGLGVIALQQAKGASLSAPIDPNMLAKVFKRPNNSKTEYPDVIWRYLNSVPPEAGKGGPTRRELLINRWVELGRVPPLTTVKGRAYARVLAGTVPQKNLLTIDLLDDRMAMLLDLRAEINQIYKELLNVMLVVRAL
jgi:hypothetical protein